MMNWGAILTKGNAIIVKWSKILTVIGGVILIGLALMIFVDVFARYIFHRPIEGVVEMGSIFLGYVVFLPQALTLIRGGHVKIDVTTRKLPPRIQTILEIFACVLGLVVISIATYDGWVLFLSSLRINERMGVSGFFVPWYVGKLAVPIGLFFLALMFLNRLLLNITQLLSKKEPPGERPQEKKEDIEHITVKGEI